MAGKYEKKREGKGILRKCLVTLSSILVVLIISIGAFYLVTDKSAVRDAATNPFSNSSTNKVSVGIAKTSSSAPTNNASSSPEKEKVAANKTDVLLYNNAYITVYYRRCEKKQSCDNIVFYVENNYDRSVALMLESVALDGDSVNIGWNESVAAHSKGEIAFPADDRLPTLNPKIMTLNCYIFDYDNLDDITEFDAIDVDLTGNSTQKKADIVTSVSLTAGETVSAIADGLSVVSDIIGDFQALIKDIENDSNFDSLRAQNYEKQWQAWKIKTDTLLNNLSQQQPVDNLADAWNSLVLLTKDMNRVAHNLSNWDTNNDNLYLDDEMEQLVNGCLKTIQESAKYMPAIDDGIKLYSENLDTTNRGSTVISGGSKSSTNNNQVKGTTNNKSTAATPQVQTCIECGKSASQTYKNPFSGKLEHYCFTHYQEIIDIMSMMESDVGESKQSKHTCEQCSREGTHRYESFTGQTEYYCTQHYEELKDLLNAFGLN